MSNHRLIAGLDIGTQNIKILAVQIKDKENLEVVAQFQQESKGVRKGVVINPEEVSIIIQELLSRTNQGASQKIEDIYVNTNGCHLFTQQSRGLISVSRADQRISEEDVQRVLQASQAISLPPNKEIFETIPREFIIDGQRGIKTAAGLQGVRLEADVLVLGGFAPYLENLEQAVLDSEIQNILDRIPSPIASAKACLSDRQKELGTALIDIGAGTTGLSVFEEGDLIHLAVLPMGSNNITNDIAIGFKTDIDIAERIKIEYGSCLPTKKQKREKIETGEGESLVFTQKQLVGIIVPRVAEILNEANKELKKISKEKLLPGGVVLTGGGAKMPKIEDLAKKIFKLPVKIGHAQGILNIRDPIWSVCCGLVFNGINLRKNGRGNVFSGTGKLGEKIKKLLKAFIP